MACREPGGYWGQGSVSIVAFIQGLWVATESIVLAVNLLALLRSARDVEGQRSQTATASKTGWLSSLQSVDFQYEDV